MPAARNCGGKGVSAALDRLKLSSGVDSEHEQEYPDGEQDRSEDCFTYSESNDSHHEQDASATESEHYFPRLLEEVKE